MMHLRGLGLCSRGARDFCDRERISWQDFIEDGIDAEKLIATGDHYALAVVEHARKISPEGA